MITEDTGLAVVVGGDEGGTGAAWGGGMLSEEYFSLLPFEGFDSVRKIQLNPIIHLNRFHTHQRYQNMKFLRAKLQQMQNFL